MSVRYRRMTFRLAYVMAGAVLLAAGTDGAALFILGLVGFLLVSFRLCRLAVWLEVVVLRYAGCSSCGVRFDLCDRWRCRSAIPNHHHRA